MIFNSLVLSKKYCSLSLESVVTNDDNNDNKNGEWTG